MPATRPFPGIAFRVETPTTVDLPRMDIAAFVGFAPRGPLDVPVVVESYTDFVDIFGGFYRLAWDGETSIWQTACLAPAVKAFFAQGGRRCWVVRVASTTATTTAFPLAGLLQTTSDSYAGVSALARCPGSWADDLKVAVELLFNAMRFTPKGISPADRSLTLTLFQGRQRLQAGDLMQLDFSDRRHHRAYAVVPSGHRATEQETVTPTFPTVHWFHCLQSTQLPLRGIVHTVAPATRASISGELKSTDDPLKSTEVLVTDILGAATLTLPAPGLNVVYGDWLRLEIGTQTLWLLVESITRADGTTAQELAIAQVWGEGADPATRDLDLARVQQVQMALKVHPTDVLTDDRNNTLLNLAGSAPHPRFIGYLPTDEELLAPRFGPPGSPSINPAAALWQEVAAPRFPLSLRLDESTTVLPLGLDATARWRSAQIPLTNPLVRDGVVPAETLTASDWSEFLRIIFLDPYLRRTNQRSLVAEAIDRLYLQEQSLKGIHALFPIEEISIIVLTDAAHRGWQLTQAVDVAPLNGPLLPPPIDPCAKVSPFSPCDPLSPDISGIQPAAPIPTTGSTQWQLLSPEAYDENGLLDIQQAVARLAAARADLVAVFGVPKHYRLPETLAHQQQLLTRVRRDGDTTDSYIALYHPWLVSRTETGDLIHTHPAGSMAGVMADRSLRRGAWIAPANEVIQDALATLPRLSLGDEQTLYSSGINPIRQMAQGFVAWGSYTQSSDPDLEDLNVRRLLILLRRLALREGQTYVFAPHSDAFRRRVQQQFEQVLARLFTLGAFAGRSTTEAYQVVIDSPLNGQNAIERGQLIVELRVAPSQPMTFITVRLLQSENSLLTVQEVRPNGR